ncbi:MAG: TIGR02281 family clan AA aspartic protease [Moraxellaceae bacterium]|nr:TIGR02281 family clan AA aspartic protease [Moraxellaceae bacterium]MBK9186834.1 TIGR02281 family clan AA aspartic protease [Moraxellaceae bacterium]
MVYRQQKLACLFGVILGASCNSFALEVKVLGLFGDRAFIKVDGKSAVIKIGQQFQQVELVALTPQQATLKIEAKDIVLVAGQEYISEPVIINEPPKIEVVPVNKVDIYANLHQQYIVNGLINNRTVTFLVDTGANSVSMTRKDAQRLGIDFRLKGKEGVSGTANGVVKNWQVMLDTVKVGTISLRYVEASIRDSEDNMPILLGMSFLKRVKLEQSNQRMTLTAK